MVMPTYNQARFLPEALASYRNQVYPSSCLVVVNDASTDETPQLLELHTPKLHVVNHTRNKGTAEAINSGVEALGPEFDALTWISSDNWMAKQWLSRLVETMSERDAGVVYGGFWYLVPGKRDLYIFRYHERDRLIEDKNCYYGPAFLIRRDVWTAAGSHRGRISHDYDHWLRVEEVCYRWNLPIVGVDEPLCMYNAHDQRVTVTRADQYDAHHWQAEARKRRAKS